MTTNARSIWSGTRGRAARGDDTTHGDRATHDGGSAGRPTHRSIGLPTGRAIVGGLLVATSGLGIFAAHRSASLPDRTEWLVLRRDVAAGSAIAADDLASAPMTLADATRSRAVGDPADVIGRIALVPMVSGDLVLRSGIAAAGTPVATAGRRVGLSLDAADALGGRLAVGDRVDVVSVPTAEESSAVIVRGAMVGAIDGGEDASVGSVDALGITLDVPDEEAARRVIDAHAKGGVTLITASTVTLDAAP